MVELCELKLIDRNLESQWPSDIDEHIAQLDFQRSSEDDDGDDNDVIIVENNDVDGNSLFSSVAFDPTIISTDSLDMEKLHARCEVKKNDYKLTFEDSGQWTSGNFTTWGRIRSSEPLDDKTNSLPEFGSVRKSTVDANDNKGDDCEKRRPSSLLATFVERQPDFELTDLYVGNGRYVDVNDNEVGFVPQSTEPIQLTDRWLTATRLSPNPPAKPRRTFADFGTKAPELEFMLMNHRMPSFCQSSVSMNELLEKVREGVLEDEKLEFSVLSILEKRAIGPDSGLGSSATASSGPSHIEDWSSLAILLPKHVVEACSFFKANTRLLIGSNNIERNTVRRSEACRTCLNVRRRIHLPIWSHSSSTRNVLCNCTSSEIVDRDFVSKRDRAASMRKLKIRTQELNIVGMPIYDAKRKMVENVVECVAEVARGGPSANLCAALGVLVADGLREKHAWEMIVTMTAPGPATRDVCSVIAELNRDEKSLNSRVLAFFNKLLRLRSLDCWICYVILKENVLSKLYFDGAFMLRASTAYRSLFWRLLESLEVLLLLENYEKLTVVPSLMNSAHHSSTITTTNQQTTLPMIEASRLASDSRVPKSSSMPARLSRQSNTYGDRCCSNEFASNGVNVQTMRRSRIPLLSNRPQRSKSTAGILCAERNANSNRTISNRRALTSAINDLNEPGLLYVSRGEPLRILTTRGQMSRCCRLRPRHDRIRQGFIPLSNLAIKKF